MKILTMLLACLLYNNGCMETSTAQDAISLEYSALSRGTFKHIKINKKQISIQNDRTDQPIIKPCNKDDWKTLMAILNSIDIKNVPNLKAPSKRHLFDGAAIANLKIQYQDSTYKTQSFDHGNPPKQITKLVKEMLSLAENIE